MSDRTLRFLVAAAITLLLVYQIGAIVAGVLGAAWGAVSSAAVAGVSLVTARLARAGGRSSFWFLLPTLLFTAVPVAATVWRAVMSESSAFDRVVSLTPFLVGFALPLALLLVVYYELRRRGAREG